MATTTPRTDFPAGTTVTYQGSIEQYRGQEMTVLGPCGRRACCSPVTVPGVVFTVHRLRLLAADGQTLYHVHPTKSITAAGA